MPAENVPSRGNGFIISGGNIPPPKLKQSIPYHENVLSPAKDAFKAASGAANAAFIEYAAEANEINRRFLKRLISFLIAACSLAVFFRFFTFADAIYNSGKCISVVSSVKEYESAVREAVETADLSGIKDFSVQCRTAPVIVLRSKVRKQTSAAEKLLLTSSEFAEAYTLISDGKAVYNAKTRSEAQQILSQYIDRLSVGGTAEVQSDIEIKKRVVAAKDIMSKEDCAYLLNEGGLVTVVSVADSSFEKSIPFETETKDDDSLYLGESVMLSEGSEGRARVLQQTVYKNGIAENVSVISENVDAAPVARVVRVGTKEKEVLKTGLKMPVKGTLSSPFGTRWGRMHEGIDIAVSEGTSVKAAECGKVSYVSENAGGYGKLVKINHGYGVETAYGHLSKINVKKGDVVACGTEIALSGNTGRSTGPHLHFEIIKDGSPLNPLDYLN